ncbi:hypothetical protein [Stutzerimonas chloritidismutans]|uniref:hypothetical protein n=1 Tax=Stutzerimonas chloritidismutans TaxID=203192 RepID=UPI003F148DFA
MSRQDFHQQHAARATDEARRLLERKKALGPHWLAWVATELYQLSPPEYAAMVRRALADLDAP